MLDQDSGDDDDNNTIRLRYLYRGEHKRDGRIATIACDKGTIKTKAVLAALRRDRSVDLDRFGVALYAIWRVGTSGGGWWPRLVRVRSRFGDAGGQRLGRR